jgi:uncharacterized membrane protein
MRTEPTWRIPFGILLLLVGLVLYALGVAWLSQWIGQLPIWAQTVVYLVLGVVWILPLKPFLAWMQTGRIR